MKIKLLIFFAFLLYKISAQTFTEKLLVNIEKFKSNIEFLGSDSLEGRETGTKGAVLAAEFITNQLAELNLKPATANGYYQNLPIHQSTPLKSSKLTLFNDTTKRNFIFGKDYFIYKSGEQTIIPSPLPMVFVGYGITAPEFDYNDYQNIDVEGKIVVMLSDEPYSNVENYFNGEFPTLYSYAEAKQRIAISRGASGSIIIPNSSDDRIYNWNNYQRKFEIEDMSLAYSVSSNLNLLFNNNSASALFENCQYSLNDVFEMCKQNKIKSFPLNVKLSFSGNFLERDFISYNVAAMLEGSDDILKNQYLIISAHYDHLGIGPEINGDSIYNGVADNAVGVAAVLEIARSISQMKYKPKRSIIFLFLTGEEKQLLGSSYYTDHPIVPLFKTIANVNIDGISMFDKIKSIIGIGNEFSTLQKFLQKTANDLNLTLTNIPPQFEQHESFYLSDQIAFAQAGIPSIMLMEGNDYENLNKSEGNEILINFAKNVYHTPFDDLSQKINFNAASQFIGILENFILKIANADEIPEWNENSPFKNIRLKTIAEQR
ncbi:MAG: M20/M25/M40 family metallo-hydrolase [Ignavibacteriales bacterium]|nr:M20/M25/M40 family metallo-hydrolase [Ignavibacteriales bacterium]